MTITTVPEVLRTEGFTVSPELDVDTLFGQMIELGAAQTDHPTGFYWTFSKDPQDWNADCMMVGVRGDVAALEWFT